MKSILPLLSILLLLITQNVLEAQITLETTYDNGGQKLFMVDFETSGMKYVKYSSEPNDRYLDFYHLDHSLWKSIDCNSFPTLSLPSGSTQYFYYPLYITEHLFDCDDKIEFLYFITVGDTHYTGIFNENGGLVLDGGNVAPSVVSSVPQQYRPIYNTPNGTKMILSDSIGDAHVYNLPCELATGIDLLFGSPYDNADLLSYPNPAFYGSTIVYALPDGVNEGEIVLHDIDGREIRRFRVDRTFNELKLSIEDFATGTYFYSLLVDGQSIISKRLIVLKQ